MGDQSDEKNESRLETELLVRQSLKYAEDIAKVYEEEKAKRKELEAANERLRIEVAERTRCEDAFRESEERFRAIFETAQDCIYIKDRSLKYTHVNPAMETLFRLPGSKIIGTTDAELYGKEAALHLAGIDSRVLGGEVIEEEHTRLVCGFPTTFLETKAPLHGRSGEIVGLCGIARNITDRKRIEPGHDVTQVEYVSRAMRSTLEKARLVASQETIVLLLGESGAGKDWLARYIHDNSNRAGGPFFAINCASVTPDIAESELFGHEVGAFTGASARKRGLLELAEGGSLFLNEVGELSPTLQAKLLAFLDTRSFTRVGGEKNISVNARLITATNRDLEEEVGKGRFRKDLFYRLNVLSIRIPPLRERTEDIPMLVRQIVSQLQKEIRLVAPPVFDEEVLEAFISYPWTGNVRELRNCLERALILSGGGKMTKSCLDAKPALKDWTYMIEFPEGRSLNDVAEDLKRSLVVEALRRSRGNKVAAARLLGISRNSLNHYVATLNIRG